MHTEQDTLAVLSIADDPLLLGVRSIAEFDDTDRRSRLLLDVVRCYGGHCSVDAVREMRRTAQRLARRQPGEAWRLLSALSNPSDIPAELWLRALLLESLGSADEALAIFDTLPDPDQGNGRTTRLLACARAMLRCGRHDQAAFALRDAINCASSYQLVQAADTLLDGLGQRCAAYFRRRAKIAIVGTTTLDFFAPALRALCFAAGSWADIYVGAYNQYQQEILDPTSPLAAFGPDIVILAPHWQALGLCEEDEHPDATVDRSVSMLRNLWAHCRDRLHAFVVQHNFEVPDADPYGRLSWSLPGGRCRLLQRINTELLDAERREPGIAIVDLDQVAAQYGKSSWTDPALWHSAKQYPSVDAILPLLRQDVAVMRCLWGLTAKCLALDLDGTLWGGVIGEDGIAGIDLGGPGSGEAYVAFQRYVQALQRRGVILAVCSKNNPEEALQVFRDHPEMLLAEDDVAMFEISWAPKDEGLRHIAETLNIGLDSIVFVDDSPRERAFIRRQIPQVTVPELPTDPARFVAALASGLYFEPLAITEDDRQRTRGYRDNAERSRLETSSSSVDEFLRSLRMEVELRPFDEVDLPRIVQLINKTNQFNLTNRRRTEAEIRDLMRLAHVYTHSMRVKDRFGDNGLTGLLIAIEEQGYLRVDTWLLSCRVMGRRVEEAMLGSLLRQARLRNVRGVKGECMLTAKNSPVHDLYDRLGFEFVEQSVNGDRTYLWSLDRESPAAPSLFILRDMT